MEHADFFGVVHAQRACRAFTTDPVPDGDIAAVLDAAVHAPSAENLQPWVFVVVADTETRQRLGDIARRQWHDGGREHAAATLGRQLLDEVDRSVTVGFGGAPVLVVVGGDLSTGIPRRALPSSIFPAVQNLLLAANALGYGATLTTLASYAPEEVRLAVGMPTTVEPLAIVPIGRAATKQGPPRRLPISEKAHRDRFGTPFP